MSNVNEAGVGRADVNDGAVAKLGVEMVEEGTDDWGVCF